MDVDGGVPDLVASKEIIFWLPSIGSIIIGLSILDFLRSRLIWDSTDWVANAGRLS